jgi:hypothetical protein
MKARRRHGTRRRVVHDARPASELLIFDQSDIQTARTSIPARILAHAAA